ncbi:hypothetical protein, partial [Streptomyces sp. 1222.5]|uniref:hypothetical protein n=1 Tax=Streptomyces sp. 1222.5 TaxID=1881026 RepID=UPI003D7393EB
MTERSPAGQSAPAADEGKAGSAGARTPLLKKRSWAVPDTALFPVRRSDGQPARPRVLTGGELDLAIIAVYTHLRLTRPVLERAADAGRSEHVWRACFLPGRRRSAASYPPTDHIPGQS